MKKIMLILSFLFVMISAPAAHDQVVVLKKEDPIGNMQKITSLNGFLFMADQPDKATLKDLKNKGFKVIINIRDQSELTFDEKAIVTDMGLSYYNVPLLKDGRIQDSAVKKIHDIVKDNEDKKILLHCSSANRAASFLGAHLVRDMGYKQDIAMRLAKQAGVTKESMEKILRAYFDSLIK